MRLEEFLDIARDSLGDYCMNTCKARCCKKGRLPLENKQEQALFQTTEESIALEPKCSKLLQDNKCSVYTARPKACRQFPLYLHGKTVLVSTWCEGYKAGLLTDYLEEIDKQGYTIHKI